MKRERTERKTSRLQAHQQPHQKGLALCHKVILDPGAHWWVQEGHPRYTGASAEEGRVWPDVTSTKKTNDNRRQDTDKRRDKCACNDQVLTHTCILTFLKIKIIMDNEKKDAYQIPSHDHLESHEEVSFCGFRDLAMVLLKKIATDAIPPGICCCRSPLSLGGAAFLLSLRWSCCISPLPLSVGCLLLLCGGAFPPSIFYGAPTQNVSLFFFASVLFVFVSDLQRASIRGIP